MQFTLAMSRSTNEWVSLLKGILNLIRNHDQNNRDELIKGALMQIWKSPYMFGSI